MGTNIYIQSDFIEPYDNFLHDPMGEIRWKRLSRGGGSRREIFKLLDNYVAGVCTYRDHVAPHGTVQELYDKYAEREINGIWNGNWDKTGICSPLSEIVVYTDEYAHRGEGKKICNIEDSIIECPDAYASVLLRNNQEYSISRRELFIGNRLCLLTYVSLTDAWRSNCGHVVIIYEGQRKFLGSCKIPFTRQPFTNKVGTFIESPMFAFDYIETPVASSSYPGGHPERFFVDFNEAPGLPEQVVINDYLDARKGECVDFSEIIPYEDIAESIEKTLKSEN
jgi:hypothetical protein